MVDLKLNGMSRCQKDVCAFFFSLRLVSISFTMVCSKNATTFSMQPIGRKWHKHKHTLSQKSVEPGVHSWRLKYESCDLLPLVWSKQCYFVVSLTKFADKKGKKRHFRLQRWKKWRERKNKPQQFGQNRASLSVCSSVFGVWLCVYMWT